MDVRRSLLSGLIDYAGLFPPASLELADAASEYLRLRTGPHAWLVGRFICPGSRLRELEDHLESEPWRISALLDLPSSSDGWYEGLHDRLDQARVFAERAGPAAEVEIIELALPARVARPDEREIMTEALPEILSRSGLEADAFVEIPQQAEIEPVADLLADGGLRAKIRCGGPDPEAFPAPARVAAFIAACIDRAIPFKATAGLHHPFRHLDPETGFVRHGFLNLVAATILGRAHRVGEEDLASIVADHDQDAFRLDAAGVAWRNLTAGPEQIEAGRSLFVAYGSCDIDEPIEDLQKLGMLE